MRVYPVFLNIDGRPCLVVGGGAIGERKVQDLLLAGARVSVVSREATPTLLDLARRGEILYRQENFTPEHLDGMVLVIGATNNLQTNREISAAAQARGLPVNIVDAPALCTFIVPATVRRGELTLAIGTGGQSPALAKKLRQDLEQLFGSEYGPYLELLGAVRAKVLASRRDHPDNLTVFTNIVHSPLLELVRNGDREGIRKLLATLVGAILPPVEMAELQTQAASLFTNSLPTRL
ncbi:precorrin-2 dehydrogenase/sirohydrochlorin ferrochelatase family protein [Desulfobacca acetoxidans]|uniref:precorrin-2 dehydrogenase n=1 Tax=Desulfobacca acetoxidans (strain ATCC 700848 / DSM 11109 / ASRB2) TaxID=880072 RepID=F2NI96_DESAR|nr:bifunctional precorrin-2 dehydrogenase/sirohydrochlorin ferrochelatase [Desulfobacca acetoxidans]AEB09865.1 siroheme synthase [Desulfobacca acetoxidans DSM 11109]